MKIMKLATSAKSCDLVDIEEGTVYRVDSQRQVWRVENGAVRDLETDPSVCSDLRQAQESARVGETVEISFFGGVSRLNEAPRKDIERWERMISRLHDELTKLRDAADRIASAVEETR